MNIKSYISSFLAVAGLLCLNACSLDKEPSGSADMKLNTISDFESQTRSCYAGFRSSSYYGGTMLLLADVMSDNLIITNSGRQTYREFFIFNIQATNGSISSFWNTAYNVILQANCVIEPLEGHNKFEGTSDEKTSYGLLAEAYTARAMAHFDLVRLFAPRYVDAASAASIKAIPYVTGTDPLAKPSRNTLAEVYEYILNDLTKAYALMEKTGDLHNATINTRFKQQSIAAVFSRVYLTMAADGNNLDMLAEAQAYAFDAITMNGSDILDQTSFYQLWHNGIIQSNPEVLLRIAILDTDGQTIGNYYGQASSDGGFRNDYAINYNLYHNLFLGQSNDVRTSAYTRADNYKESTYAGVYKYRTRGGTSPVNTTDAVVIRTPEMYLTIAEVFARAGGRDTDALLFLNLVRTKRYGSTPSDTPAGAALLKAIQDERRKELAFEGQRFFDLKRLNLMIERGNTGDIIDGSGTPASVQSISASDARTVWPIPQSEIDINPNLKN